MTRLCVNVNKVATLRNARRGNTPDVQLFAQKAQDYGAQGITVHPRPDERHIRRDDVYLLKPLVYTEFNMEGNPQQPFVELFFFGSMDIILPYLVQEQCLVRFPSHFYLFIIE
ncbi:MAG: pyridoxine 5'-phosphate synthase [Paludibacteraceae bacterium]|nr:pyridoxine 5'-phosphate synthase [Paludibacteraceae bacterium]